VCVYYIYIVYVYVYIIKKKSLDLIRCYFIVLLLVSCLFSTPQEC